MPETDIHAEIRTIRDDLAARYDGDAWSLSAALADRSRLAGRTVISLPSRKPILLKAGPMSSAILSACVTSQHIHETPMNAGDCDCPGESS